MVKLRIKLFGLWLLCTIAAPLLVLAMFIQMLLGSEVRATSVALAYDVCGNVAMGGKYGVTVSEQVGNALKRGRQWAKISAWVIDGLMGQGHCLSKATI